MRTAHATLLEAHTAARDAFRVDGRARCIWMVRGGASAGVVVPDRFVVGLEKAGMPAAGSFLHATVRGAQ